jgi:hypothetical protein
MQGAIEIDPTVQGHHMGAIHFNLAGAQDIRCAE